MFSTLRNKFRKHFQQTPAVDLKYMSYSSEAVLKQSPLVSQLLLWVIAAFIVVMLVWASLAKIDEFTRGEGKIVPSSDIQVVQNLEGGILASLLVAEGDVVDRGQPLIQIDDTIFASTYKERSLQAEQLTIKAARLRAEANGTSFDEELAKLGGNYDPVLVASERALYESRLQEHQSQQEILNQKASQKKQELSSIKVNRQSLSDSYDLMRRELNFTRPLVAEGAVSQVELLRLERQVTDLKGELDRAAIAIPQLETAYSEAQNNVISDVPEMLSEANIALCQARMGKGSRWMQFADVSDGEVPVLGKPLNDWESYLRQAVENRLVALHFQPIYTTKDRSLVANEVFVRFLQGSDLLSAGVVIPIAERLGLMPKLDQLVLESLASAHSQDGLDGKLCVNLSMVSIKSSGFMTWLDTFLSSQRKLASKLIFEIPEYAIRSNDAPLRELHDLLERRNSTLGLDNFGVDSIAFGYLGSLSLHHLKIHRSFTRGLDSNKDNQFYIKSLAGLIHNRGMELWIEGVETEAEWLELQALGVDVAQGYFLCEPQVKPVA